MEEVQEGFIRDEWALRDEGWSIHYLSAVLEQPMPMLTQLLVEKESHFILRSETNERCSTAHTRVCEFVCHINLNEIVSMNHFLVKRIDPPGIDRLSFL